MDQPTDTRSRLVETARRLFLEQGYAGTGIAQILAESGARSGSLYHFFPTKAALLLAVLEEYRSMLRPAVVDPVFQQMTDPIDRIFGILDGYRAMLEQTSFTHGCPIGNLALELGEHDPAARALIAANFTGWREVIESCLDAVAERLPAHVDRAALALFVLTTMEGAVMLARAYHRIEPYDVAVAQLRDYFDRLLADPAATTNT